MIVMKFGGTSVGSVEAFAAVAKIVAQKVQEQAATQRPGVVVVTSAMSGVTNLLIDTAQKAAKGNAAASQEMIATLRQKHTQVIDHFLKDEAERNAAVRHLDDKLQDLDRICGGIMVLGELTPRALDLVSGLGERINAPILAAVLRAHGIQAESVDTVEIVVTDTVFGGSWI
jgi:aspartate kinase